MPMTEKAAQLYSMHKRKANKLRKKISEHVFSGTKIRPIDRLAFAHEEAAHAIYSCPDSWEKSETDRKLTEIKAYLGSPLYDEWLGAGAAENFEQYVADEYDKLFPNAVHTAATESFSATKQRESSAWVEYKYIDPRSLRERLHDEAGADLQRMTTNLRNGG